MNIDLLLIITADGILMKYMNVLCFQDYMVTQVVLVKEKLKEILSRTTNPIIDVSERCEVKIPATTIDELNSLQSFLSSPENFAKLVNNQSLYYIFQSRTI